MGRDGNSACSRWRRRAHEFRLFGIGQVEVDIGQLCMGALD